MFTDPEFRATLGQRQDASGRWLCACGRDAGDAFSCQACMEQHARDRDARERAEFVASWRASIERHVQFPTAPAWPWARLENDFFTSRLKGKKLLRAASSYSFDAGTLVFSGPTGCGKTACARAILDRIGTAEAQSVLSQAPGTRPTPLMRQLRKLAWVDGFALAQARKQNRLGSGEAELVELAFRAPLLVLDEVGFEPLFDTVIAEIANRRYLDGSPTIVTTGLTPAEFRDRYGDACWRRFAERGTLVEER